MRARARSSAGVGPSLPPPTRATRLSRARALGLGVSGSRRCLNRIRRLFFTPLRVAPAHPPSALARRAPDTPRLRAAFATLLLAINAAGASAQSYSYSYFYETVTFAPTAVPVPAPTALPIPAPTYAPTLCVDADNGGQLENADGMPGCEYYEYGYYACGTEDDDDFSSIDMCCDCSGGSFSTTAAPSPSPTFTLAPTISVMPTPAPTVCVSSDNGATDPYGYDCDFYMYSPSYCCWADYADYSFSSLDMCCVCGGGVRSTTERPSASPTSPSCYDLDNAEEVSTRQYYEWMVHKGYMYPGLSFSYADMVSYSFSYADVVQRMIEDVVSAESYSYTYMTPTDSNWMDCGTYSEYAQYTYWTYTCGSYDDDDFTAADLCCACGGGLDEAPEPVVLAVSLTVEMDCADCALKGGGRARASRDHALLLGRQTRESAAAAAAADGQRLGSRVEESAARCVDVRGARARVSPSQTVLTNRRCLRRQWRPRSPALPSRQATAPSSRAVATYSRLPRRTSTSRSRFREPPP